MSKSKIINIRISPELKKVAKKVAEEDGRSLSNWITRLMEKEIKKAKKAED
ncbi:MAG: YlcI/YnfO family protein [Gammaproteobacteria bacterium]|jgi:predicted HicB family RNase H-like nuclease